MVDEDILFIKIPVTKTKKPRSFTIRGAFFDICMKYMQARPSHCKTERFFIRYKDGQCTNEPMGVNKFGGLPREIANYLNLPNAEKFTGHSFRRTSATLLIDACGEVVTLQRHGAWKSASVAMGYVEESIANKNKIFDHITSNLNIRHSVNSVAGTSDTNGDLTSTSGVAASNINTNTDNTYLKKTSPSVHFSKQINIVRSGAKNVNNALPDIDLPPSSSESVADATIPKQYGRAFKKKRLEIEETNSNQEKSSNISKNTSQI